MITTNETRNWIVEKATAWSMSGCLFIESIRFPPVSYWRILMVIGRAPWRRYSFSNQLFLMSRCTLPSAAIKLNSPHYPRRVAPFFPSRVVIKVNRITGNSPLDVFSTPKASQSVHRDTPDAARAIVFKRQSARSSPTNLEPRNSKNAKI